MDDSWLGERERAVVGKMYFEKRRRDWRLGRWTAKCAILRHLNLPQDAAHVSRLEILAASDGAPELFLDTSPSPIALSISHSGETAFSVVAAAGMSLGCDLEEIRSHEDSLAADYFTREEFLAVETACDPDRPLLTTLIWSAKESVLKALRQGLRRDTRSIQVVLPDTRQEGWQPLSAIDLVSSRQFHGWWQARGLYILTIASDLVTSPSLEI